MMMARGFKPVGWVAGIAAAALGCYMLSLNVAAERAEVAKLEWRIIMAKRDIRSLQTELGTRGRLAQLENWNANVLALSAPTTNQFVPNEVTLARFDQREKTIAEQTPVHMASADVNEAVKAPKPAITAPVHYAAAPAPAPAVREPSLVRKAALEIGELHTAPRAASAPAKSQAAIAIAAPKKKQLADASAAAGHRKSSGLDERLVKEIRAAKAENDGSFGGQ